MSLKMKIAMHLFTTTVLDQAAAMDVAGAILKIIEMENAKPVTAQELNQMLAAVGPRDAFETAALSYAIERRAAGKAHFDNGAPATKESMFWRRDNGDYGVIMFNPAWWGWETSRQHYLKAAHAKINSYIAAGPLPGDGFDLTAQRNGMTLAANIVAEMIGG